MSGFLFVSFFLSACAEQPECAPRSYPPGSIVVINGADGSQSIMTVPESGQIEGNCGSTITVVSQLV